MIMRATEKIIDALSQLMEGYSELQSSIESDYGASPDDDDADEDGPLSEEVEAALVTELRASIEAVIDAEDYSPEEFASALSCMTEALEEIDPDVFESPGEEEEEYEDEEDDDVEYYDDDDIYDDYDDDEFEDEDEDEDEDDDSDYDDDDEDVDDEDFEEEDDDY